MPSRETFSPMKYHLGPDGITEQPKKKRKAAEEDDKSWTGPDGSTCFVTEAGGIWQTRPVTWYPPHYKDQLDLYSPYRSVPTPNQSPISFDFDFPHSPLLD